MTVSDPLAFETLDTRQASAGPPRRRRTAVNRVLMWVLLAICVVAPLPLGSNRPFFWTVTGSATGLTALLYGLTMHRLGEEFRFGFKELRSIAIPFLLLIGFLLIQLQPLGFLFGSVLGNDSTMAGLVPRAISIAPGATFLMLLRICTYGLFFFLVLQVAGDSARRSLMLDVLLVAITAYALVGIASLQLGDTILGLKKWAYEGSATGTFVNRNSFATFLAFGSILAFTQIANLVLEWLEERATDRSHRFPASRVLLYGVALVIIFAVLLATQSRMGFVVALAGGFVVLVFSLTWMGRSAGMMILLALLILVGAGTALVFYGGGLLERFNTLEESGQQRADLYAQILELIALRPWTGFGGGTFELAFPLVHELPVSAGLVWDKAHNTYLALWSELGIVFGSIPLLIVLVIAVRVLRALFARTGSWRAQAMVLGVIVAGGLHSLVDFSLEIQANTLLFIALLAIGWTASPAGIRAKKNQ